MIHSYSPITTTDWTRHTEKVTHYLETTAAIAGAEKEDEVIQLFHNVPLLFPQWAILSCPMMHPHIRYASDNCLQVFGHSMDYMTRYNQVGKFFAHVHDDDQRDLYEAYTFFYQYLQDIPAEQHQDIRAVFYYRFKAMGDQYIQLHDEKAALSLTNGANFYYALFQKLSDSKTFTGVKLELFSRAQPMKKLLEFKPSTQRSLLSKREEELVTLIRQGLSTKQIGYNLKISPNTVRNIKSKLFEKYQVANSIELLNRMA